MLLRRLKSAWNDRAGAVNLIFVLGLPALVAIVALAIEVMNVNTARTALQEALDSATLAAARAFVETDAERSTIATTFLGENLPERLKPLANNVTITTVEMDDGDVTRGVSNMNVPLFLPAILGMNEVSINRLTEVKSVPDGKLEVALVLDTTDSMSVGNRIQTLRTAGKDLVEEIMDGENVKVAVVPFATYINVGISNRNEPGLDIPADIPPKEECEWKDKWEKTNCKTVTEQCNKKKCTEVTEQCPNVVCKKVDATCYKDGAPFSCKKDVCETKGTKPCKKTKCEVIGKEPCEKTTCEWKKTGEKYKSCKTIPGAEWKGCVGSRNYPLNTQDKNVGNKIPGYLENVSDASGKKVRCNSEILRLNTSVAATKSAIQTLSTNGETYIAPGLIWGWRAISHRQPFADGTDASKDSRVRKAIVLMTDGVNTRVMQSGGGLHGDTNTNKSNDYLEETCQNVKGDSIDIYTVAFQVTDTTIKDLLEKCATNPSMYFDATNATALKQSFAQIAKDLKVIHISR